ncbi:MAG TPA: hypothetical protein VGJ05_15090 [Fimbriiglobus sp.]
MLAPFLIAGMRAAGRQRAFRRAVVLHVVISAGLVAASSRSASPSVLTGVGYLFLILGLVEGAALVGWRLTQLPKSQALEFLLTSPIHPRRVFAAEMLVGVGRFAWVHLAGVPVVGAACLFGPFHPTDFWPLAVMPLLWGTFAGLLITAWVYEPPRVRKVGEYIGLVGVVIYLLVGVVAGEHLRQWLAVLPPKLGNACLEAVLALHNLNPFGVVRYWFEPGRSAPVAWDRFVGINAAAIVLSGLTALRAARRLLGHFHDRHYSPRDSVRATELELIGDRPLSWWAVRRVMEYSGRVNLWLAAGFAVVYSAYLVAGDNWPPWMGRIVFTLFDRWGGPATVATALAVLAAVPAVFQYGLWDATTLDRSRRLELLLLSDLDGRDYRNAAAAAAWKRGRGYLFSALILWLALGLSGRVGWIDVLAAAVGGGLLWALSFALGFRAFARGAHANGVALAVTLGGPVLVFLAYRFGFDSLAGLIPTALPDLPVRRGVDSGWLAGALLTFRVAFLLLQSGVRTCVEDLRTWLDQNHGVISVE